MQKLQALVLLLAAYAAATWIPNPGLWLRELSLLGSAINPPELLLAGLLLCAGLCSSQGTLQTMSAARGRIIVSAIASWLLPLLAAAIVVATLWGIAGCPPQVALGIVIVAAMPVANSSVGWSTTMGGSITLSIALLVVGTALSPVLTPLAISAGAISLRTAEESLMNTPWNQGMGGFFVTWVLAPVLLGVFISGRMSEPVRQWVVPWSRRVSFFILILLNYLNGVPCLPSLAEQPSLLQWPVLGACCLLLLSFAASRVWRLSVAAFTPAAQDRPAEQISLMLSVVMRNTGAALVFAGAALPEFVSLSLTIIAYTMLQHLWAGACLASHQHSSPRDCGATK
ncbi:MAG: hypothetical protein R3C09_05895 [Pirellulaceae bacterium]